MAVLFRSKYPFEYVWITGKNRCIQFVKGVYETSDEDEIAVLSGQYEYDKQEAAEELAKNTDDVVEPDTSGPESEDVAPVEAKRRGRKPKNA